MARRKDGSEFKLVQIKSYAESEKNPAVVSVSRTLRGKSAKPAKGKKRAQAKKA
jgi:hypothetical protein